MAGYWLAGLLFKNDDGQRPDRTRESRRDPAIEAEMRRLERCFAKERFAQTGCGPHKR